jgi:hypothetical protein
MHYARADYSVVVKNTYFRTHGPRGRNSLEKWTDHHLEAELKFAHLFHDGTKESHDGIARLEIGGKCAGELHADAHRRLHATVKWAERLP